MNTFQVEWANYRFLDEVNCFMLTKTLFDMELDLGREINDSLHWSRRFEYPWVYFKLGPFNRDDIVLDAGMGPTVLQFMISKEVKEMHGIDTDLGYVNWVMKVSSTRSFDNVFTTLGDIRNITFPADYFDKVICISVLEHLPKQDMKQAIDELIRVTKPNGKITLTMDIVLEATDKQADMDDLLKIASEYQFIVPDLPALAMIFSVQPHNLPFAVCCILVQKGDK